MDELKNGVSVQSFSLAEGSYSSCDEGMGNEDSFEIPDYNLSVQNGKKEKQNEDKDKPQSKELQQIPTKRGRKRKNPAPERVKMSTENDVVVLSENPPEDIQDDLQDLSGLTVPRFSNNETKYSQFEDLETEDLPNSSETNNNHRAKWSPRIQFKRPVGRPRKSENPNYYPPKPPPVFVMSPDGSMQKRGPGRPRKNLQVSEFNGSPMISEYQNDSFNASYGLDSMEEPSGIPVKRGRGRPRKGEEVRKVNPFGFMKRPRGRPRLNPIKERRSGPGRPRIHPVKIQPAIKRSRGRPRTKPRVEDLQVNNVQYQELICKLDALVKERDEEIAVLKNRLTELGEPTDLYKKKEPQDEEIADLKRRLTEASEITDLYTEKESQMGNESHGFIYMNADGSFQNDPKSNDYQRNLHEIGVITIEPNNSFIDGEATEHTSIQDNLVDNEEQSCNLVVNNVVSLAQQESS